MVAVSLKKKIFFKQKTAYEMSLCDWSSDVCSSDLETDVGLRFARIILDKYNGEGAELPYRFKR